MRRSWLPQFVCTTGLLLAVATAAEAHFLWVDVTPAPESGKPVAAVYFNEGPEAGSARLAAKIAPTTATIASPGAKPTPLELKLVEKGDTGCLEAQFVARKAFSIQAHFEYGIFRHEGEPILLNYYAQHLSSGAAAESTEPPTGDAPLLAVVPRREADGWQFEVLWQGKPAADCQVVVTRGDNDEQELVSDARGRVRPANATAGSYAVRARKVEARTGEKNGQAFNEVHHYATLTVRLNSGDSAASADQVLSAARSARAEWDDFPGFTADLTIRQGSEHAQGRLKVGPDGDVLLSGFDSLKTDRAQRILDSLVQHRTGGGGPEGGVTFVPEQSEHPLGRMIRFDDDKDLLSAYRVQDDVITEVNRVMGNMRFTISVVDVYRNPEGKYLPRTFNIGFWDKESGALKATEMHLNDWTRVGRFDLPQRIVVLRSENNKNDVVSMDLGGLTLLDATKK